MIEASALEHLPPDIERRYWRTASGERAIFDELVLGLDARTARQVAEQHADAICAHARAAARLADEHANARWLADAAGRLCEEVTGFWPRDSWKPIP